MGMLGFSCLYPELGPRHCPRCEVLSLASFDRALYGEIPPYLKGLSSALCRKENLKNLNYAHT